MLPEGIIGRAGRPAGASRRAHGGVGGFDLVVGRFFVLDPGAVRKEQGNHTLSVIGVPATTVPVEVAPIVPSFFSSQLSHADLLQPDLPDVENG